MKIVNIYKNIKKKNTSKNLVQTEIKKKKFWKFKNEGILNTSIKSNNYVNFLKESDDASEKIYGMKNEDYRNILNFCEIDQIDRTKPDLPQAFEEIQLIAGERKNIRRKFLNKNKINNDVLVNSKITISPEKMNLFTKTPKFNRKKIVIKNSGLKMKGVVKNEFIPIIVKPLDKLEN